MFAKPTPEESVSVAVNVAGELDETELLLATRPSRAAEAAVPVTVNPSAALVTATPPTVAVAVTVSAPNCVPASNEIRAIPDASVNAVAPAGENVAKPVPNVAKRTSAPVTSPPLLSRTVADKEAGVFEESALVDDDRVTRAALVVPVEVKPKALLVTAVPPTVAVAVTESAPDCVPGFNVMLAIPLLSVNAVAPAGKNVPKPAAAVAKVTTTPGTKAPALFRNVPLRVAGVVADTALVEPVRTRVADATVPVPVPVPGAVDVPDPPPPQPKSNARNASATKEAMARAGILFNLYSCYGVWKRQLIEPN